MTTGSDYDLVIITYSYTVIVRINNGEFINTAVIPVLVVTVEIIIKLTTT